MFSHHIKFLATIAVSLLGAGGSITSFAEFESVGLSDVAAIHSNVATQSVMLSVARAGSRVVGVGERGFIIVSDDNGSTWKQVDSPVGVTLVKVRFVDSVKGWAVGHAGVVLHTEDGGLTWRRQLDGLQGAQIEFVAAREAADASGADLAAQERLAQAQQLVAEGPDKPLLDLLFFNDQEGLVVGAYGLALATQDGGETWQSLRGQITNPSGLHLYALEQVGADVFAAGEQGLLLKSEDHGKSFQPLTSPYEGTAFGLQSTPDGGLVLYGLRGNAFRSYNQGKSWQKLKTLEPATLTSSFSRQDGTVLLVNESGSVIELRPGSNQATKLTLPLSGYFTGLVVAADGRLIISSARGMLLASGDATINGDGK